jgi:hypothetical protein
MIACLALMTGCAQAIPQTEGKIIGPARYTVVELYATVVNAGSSKGYTVFEDRSAAVTVLPDSSAQIAIIHTSPPGFENTRERLRWIEAGRPQFPETLHVGTGISLKAGAFSFLPFPPKLSFQEVTALAPSPARIKNVVLGDAPLSPASDLSFYLAMQVATLMAIAPVNSSVRHAAWKALVSLAGIHACTGGHDIAGRSGSWICINTPVNTLKILTNAKEQQVLCLEELITAPSLRYPGVPAGSVILSNTYLPWRPG